MAYLKAFMGIVAKKGYQEELAANLVVNYRAFRYWENN